MIYIVTKYQNDGNSVQTVLHYDQRQLNFASEKGAHISVLIEKYLDINNTLIRIKQKNSLQTVNDMRVVQLDFIVFFLCTCEIYSG